MEGTRYTTRESLRVRRWFIERQIELCEARLHYWQNREIEQIKRNGKPAGKTNRKLMMAEQEHERLTFELDAINDLIADTQLRLFSPGLASA